MMLHTRSEDTLIRRNEFANPEPEAAAPNEGRTDATKRARRDETDRSQEYQESFEQLGWS